MGFVVPTFAIACNVKTMIVPNVPSVPLPPYRLTNQPCNLAWGRRVNVASSGGTSAPGVPIMCMTLLLPKQADVRGPQDAVSSDMVECPAGSGRWYYVIAVDDIGKGFQNEHRAAMMRALDGSWTPPYA